MPQWNARKLKCGLRKFTSGFKDIFGISCSMKKCFFYLTKTRDYVGINSHRAAATFLMLCFKSLVNCVNLAVMIHKV